jgi:hypothetical protein
VTGVRKFLVAGCAFLAVAAAGSVAAVMIPTYVQDKLAVTPLDIRSSIVASTPDGQGGDVLDTSTIAGAGPLEVSTGVPLELRRLITVEEPSDADKMTFQASVTVSRGDRDPGLLTASVDRVTIDRRTAVPVEPAGSIQTAANAPAVPLPRTGFQHRFPFGTERKTYPVYDATAWTTFPAEFVEAIDIDGVEIYHFRSTVVNQDLSLTTQSPINTVTLPASKWGLGGDAPITMKRYYSNTREIYVEPRSGGLVGGQEQPFQYFARDAAVPEVTILKASLSLSEESQAEQIARAGDSVDKLEWIDRGPIILWTVAGVSLVVGLILLVAASRRPRGDAPNPTGRR